MRFNHVDTRARVCQTSQLLDPRLARKGIVAGVTRLRNRNAKSMARTSFAGKIDCCRLLFRDFAFGGGRKGHGLKSVDLVVSSIGEPAQISASAF